MKNVLVLGLGASGVSAVDFLANKGYLVYAYDKNFELFTDKAIVVKSFSSVPIDSLAFAVVSPGVDVNSAGVLALKKAGVRLLSELELGASACKGKLFAITGTNGKTTCTNLLNHIFEVAGRKSLMVGNVGIPISSKVKEIKRSTFVMCEVSSFQMETTSVFKPQAAVLLNIEPDHLDRHKTMDEYVRLKTLAIKDAKYKVFNADNELSFEVGKKFKHALFFSCNKITNGAYVLNGNVFYKNKIIMPLCEIKLRGRKNLENVLACVALARLAGVSPEQIRRGVGSFVGLEHRMEVVGEHGGVTYVNDSKSTNVASTLCALEAFKGKNIILLLGGKSKEIDFNPIFGFNLKSVICYGECGAEIFASARAREVHLESTLKDAFRRAASVADEGDIVLLSPACASFDEFSGFEERGKFFKSLCNRLITGE